MSVIGANECRDHCDEVNGPCNSASALHCSVFPGSLLPITV